MQPRVRKPKPSLRKKVVTAGLIAALGSGFTLGATKARGAPMPEDLQSVLKPITKKIDIANPSKNYRNYEIFVRMQPRGITFSKTTIKNILSRAYRFGLTQAEYANRVKKEAEYEALKGKVLFEVEQIFPYISKERMELWLDKRLPPQKAHTKSEFLDAAQELLDEIQYHDPLFLPRSKQEQQKQQQKTNNAIARLRRQAKRL